ncbi:MAG: ABC transporter permease [Bacillaceae bacterium]|nr:ABC transporter permease [Bacillaceae bacterium]
MNLDVSTLWSQRFQAFSRNAIFYLGKIGNSGFLFVILLLFIAGAYYYRSFLDWLPASFPVSLFLAVIFGFLTTRGGHRTLLKPADLIYLTPLELNMGPYFARSYFYNWAVQGAGLFILAVILNPLYTERIYATGAGISFWGFVFTLLLLKGANLFARWIEARLHHKKKRRILFFLRMIASTLWILSITSLNTLPVSGILAMMLTVYAAYEGRQIQKSHAYNWETLIRMEQVADARFYRFVNQFVDVGHLQDRVVYRRILPGLAEKLPFHKTQAYRYILIKMLFRGGALWGMLLRLTLVNGLMVYLIPDFYGELAVYILFLMVTGMQMRAFWPVFHRQFMFRLYPLPDAYQRSAFASVTFTVLMIQALFAAIPHLFHQHGIMEYILLPVAGAGVAYLYSFVVLYRYLTRNQQEEQLMMYG